MSALSGTTLSVAGTSVLTGGANINGTTNTNNLNIINNSNFSQSGIGTFSTGTGAVLLNGATTTNSTLVVGTDLTVNSIINMNATNGILKLPTGRQITSNNDVVDNTSNQNVAGVKTFTGQIVANAGINAGANSITCGSLTCSSETDSGVLTVTGQLNANGGIATSNSNINAGTGSITCGSLTCSSETDSGILTVSGVLNANGGISTGNQAINAGTGSITCGSLTCSSETDSGSFTIGGTLYLGSGATNYLQLLQSSNAIYYDFLQSGGSHNFRYVYSGGSTSILNMSNTAINMYQPLVTNNNNINAGTGSITCGSITSSGILQATTSTASVTSSLYTSNSLATNLYTLSIGSNYFTTNPAVNISWLNNSSTPWGLIGLSGAGGTAVNFDNNGVLIGSQGKPANSTTYKLEVGGSTLLNGAVSTNNNNLTVGSGTITCGANFNIGAYGTTNMLQYSNGQLYFTNNASGTASSASANSGFNFRNLYFNGTGNVYQNFLLINDKTDGTNYYNNNILPIYASGGITIGSNQNITLASTYTTPTSGQLGYNFGGSGNSNGLVSSGSQSYYSTITLPVGTWILRAKLGVNTNLGGPVTITNVSTGFGTNYSTGSFSYNSPISMTLPGSTTATLSNDTAIVTITSSTTYYFYGVITFTGYSYITLQSTGPAPNTFNATRIA